MKPRRLTFIMVLFLLCAGLLVYQRNQTKPLSASHVSTVTSPAASQPTGNIAYSLTIPAQKARTYPGSAVTVHGSFTPEDGYREGSLSYFSDGLKINAAVMLPLTPAPTGGYPVIIFDHGYVLPSAYETNDPFYIDFASAFAARGFAVITPDYRGNGNSWGIPEGAFYSAGYVADTLNLATSLQHYSVVNASQLSLIGHSMGGHVALVAALVRPGLFRSVVLAAGSVGTEVDMYDNWRAFSDFGDPLTLGIRQRVIALFGQPDSGTPFWKAADPYTHLVSLQAPLMLAQDPNDDTVPYRFAEELDTAAIAAGRRVTLKQYDGGHSFDGSSRAQFDNDAAAFIRRNLTPTVDKITAVPPQRKVACSNDALWYQVTACELHINFVNR